jgi:MoaA/NifB/PqqE/SkfB family radical SAM enzyme
VDLVVRRQYLRIAWRAFREGKLLRLAQQGIKVASVPLADRIGRPLAGPILGNLVVTYRCNNACFTCDLPKPWFYKERGDEELDTAGMKGVIDDFAQLGTLGLSLTGGEPTLRPDCFALLEHAAARGMLPHLNTNAYTLQTADQVRALLDTGVESMNISVDGAVPETHDRLRHARLGFERVARATELVIAQRRGGRPSLTYTFVVGPENHREVPAFIDLARGRGIDSVSFMPLHNCYRGAQPLPSERIAEMDDTIRQLVDARRTGDDFLDNSEAYLSLFPRAFRGEPSPLRCFVGYNCMLVDCFGNVYPCAFFCETGRSVGNVRDTPLRTMWRGPAYQDVRRTVSECRECYWNCHTEMNLLYQRAPAELQ